MYPLAEKELKRSLELDPYNLQALERLGALYNTQKEYDKALVCFEAGVQIEQSSFNYLRLGETYLKLNLNEKAYLAFKKGVDMHPDVFFCYSGLAEYYVAVQNYDEAIVNQQHVIDINPNPRAYEKIGGMYFSAGQKDKAKEAWQKASDLDPNGGNGGNDARKHLADLDPKSQPTVSQTPTAPAAAGSK